MTGKTLRKMCVLAGIAVLAVSANAFTFDAHIMIDRALNSPTLTIRYTGAHAALVDLLVNGASIGTRSVTASKDTGETNFTLNLSDLKDGDNDVEVRLFDRTGKLVGSDHRNISTDQSQRGPVYLTSPKVGATVRGAIQVQLGFGQDLRNAYVSFFVDSNFKKMSNYPPYSYDWDTTRETNGWHTIEAWAIDDTSTTFKSKQTRVFIDNPGGQTHRVGVDDSANITKPQTHSEVDGTEKGIRDTASAGHPKASDIKIVKPVTGSVTKSNAINPTTGSTSGTKPAPNEQPKMTNVRVLTPTDGKRLGHVPGPTQRGEISITDHSLVAMAPPQTPVTEFASFAKKITITKGQRVPSVRTFAIQLNNQYVKFDVQPRVDNGVPMTPFRYLLEKDGGKVDWANMTKTVSASADGKHITIQIGDRDAKVNAMTVTMEVTPYIDHGRTIVPLSFIHDALGVNVEYDKETNHVLITSVKK